jgi:glycosyltransferase involved in cell wall biosynthesis
MPVFDRWLAGAVKRLGIPLVHTIHDVELLFQQGRFTGRLQDVYAHVDAFVLHTEENRSRFLKIYPAANAAAVHVIPHILPRMSDERPPVSDDQAKQLARQTLQINPSAFVVLAFGLVKAYKGFDILAQAIPPVTADDAQVEFWIVGKPDTEADKQVLESLRQLKQVHVRADYIPSNQVWQYHLAADVIVFPYRRITQSGALSTALNYGRAVIVTDVGGLPEAVNGNGWVIPPEDAAALAGALREAVADRARVQQMGVHSQELIARFHAPDVVGRQFVALYERLTYNPDSLTGR